MLIYLLTTIILSLLHIIFSMAGFSTILNELLNLLDGSKMTTGGLYLLEYIKDNSGKEITERKKKWYFYRTNNPKSLFYITVFIKDPT